jgi:hypothetical protein
MIVLNHSLFSLNQLIQFHYLLIFLVIQSQGKTITQNNKNKKQKMKSREEIGFTIDKKI